MQTDMSPFKQPDPEAQAFDAAMELLRSALIDGMDHGFFEASISVETRKADRREVTIRAGKSYKFSIRVEDLWRLKKTISSRSL